MRKKVVLIILLIIINLFQLSSSIVNAKTGSLCPSINIYIEKPRYTTAPAPFIDDNIPEIKYDITVDITQLPQNRNYNVFTDNGVQSFNSNDYNTKYPIFENPPYKNIVLDPNDPKLGHITGNIVRRSFFYDVRSFWEGDHTLKLKYDDGSNNSDLCIGKYSIVAGLTQFPIRCSITAMCSGVGCTDPLRLTSTNDIKVQVQVTPISVIELAKILWKDLYYKNDQTVTQATKIKGSEDATFIPPNEFDYTLEAGTLLPGKNILGVLFLLPPPVGSSIPIPKGSCWSPVFNVCSADDQNPACLFPSITPTLSPSPTLLPGEPTYTPMPPLPTLAPLCDQITDPKLNLACQQCMNPPNGNPPGKSYIWTAVGCLSPDPATLIKDYVFVAGIGIAGGIAFLYFLYGAFIILTSAGNAERVEEGKQIIVSSLSGLLLLIFSVFLLKVIGVDILKLPEFK